MSSGASKSRTPMPCTSAATGGASKCLRKWNTEVIFEPTFITEIEQQETERTKNSLLRELCFLPLKKRTMQDVKELKKAICEIGDRIYKRGFAAANDGNISVRLTETEVLCTP